MYKYKIHHKNKACTVYIITKTVDFTITYEKKGLCLYRAHIASFCRLTAKKFKNLKEAGSFFFCDSTVRKTKRDAGPKHEGDGKFRHPHRTIGKIRHLGPLDICGLRNFPSMHFLLLRHAWFFLQGPVL
jgi:hypothetical protein